MVAYQPGNAANMPAAATISQTSLPSHSGPIVLMAARRPASSVPITPCSMPTPKSKPSRTKNPVHKIAMMMYQNGMRLLIVTPLVQDGRHRRVRVGLGARGWQLLAGVLQHQDQVDGAERAVQQDEYHQADPQRGDADGRGDPVLGQHDALHDPRLPAAFGQEPARGVHQERQHRCPYRYPEEHPGGGELFSPDQPQPP